MEKHTIDKEAVIKKHYGRLGEQYDKFLYYSPEFVRTLTSRMIEKLQLQPEDQLVDLGCGTGMYSLDMLKQVSLNKPIIGVDPFAEMLSNIEENAPIVQVKEDAMAYSERETQYDKILIKETVHHIEDRSKLFHNLYQQLTPGGILLLVHVPPRVHYPLFQAALDRAANWHADPDQLTIQLTEAGFTVERDAIDYSHTIPKQHYFNMVKNCYMSVLTSFEEDELEAGLAEMQVKYREKEQLAFVDHFDYLTAIKME
ncbi:Cyclopropane fatty-acyl-phospholipid synthase [Planctomycetales bacterium 10988]|nr:Cyclopropane fatty-acyl-phospholipid synthase [Planctomycetales bacterium 10988]